LTIHKDIIDEAADEAGADRNAPRTPKGVSIKPAETAVTPPERAARSAYVAELQARADAVTDPEISRELLALARRVENSLPILEFFDRLAKIESAKEDLPGNGLDVVQLRGRLDESAEQLRQSNPYPPLLMELFKRYQESGDLKPEYYVNADSSDTDRASVAAAISLLGLDAAQKASIKPLSQRERIEKAVRARMAGVRNDIDRLRADLDEFKASRGIK
jgi:hypothetical protein